MRRRPARLAGGWSDLYRKLDDLDIDVDLFPGRDPNRRRVPARKLRPFAEDLKRLQAHLINNGLIAERRLGRMFEVRPGPTYPDAARTHRSELEEWRPAIERVADLLRADTRQAEVLPSVHLAAQDLIARYRHGRTAAPSEQDVVDEVMRWKMRRKPPLDEAEVASAVRMLNVLGWIDVAASDDLAGESDFAEFVG